MYTQALNTLQAEDRNVEDAARAAQFQSRIDAEERIEPNDWMRSLRLFKRLSLPRRSRR